MRVVRANFRNLFRVLHAAGILALATSCGTQINSLKNAARITSGASGVPPDVSSLTLTDTSPTKSIPLSVAWGVEVGTHTDYCLLENSHNTASCVWHSGSLPSTYTDVAADGPFVLTAFLRNTYGVSAPIDSNTITIDRTAPTLASATVTNSDPTSLTAYALSYGAITNGSYSSYCILENSTVLASCSWVVGTLPASYNVTTVQNAKVLRVWIKDAAGNISAPVDTNSVTYNPTVPSVTISSPAAGTYAKASNYTSFPVSGACSENGQNVVISGSATATVVCAGNVWSTNLNFTAAGQGAMTIYADHSSAASVAAVQASLALNKDTVIPVLTFTGPAANSYTNASNYTSFLVTGTCTDSGQNVVVSGDASATVLCVGGIWSANLDFTAASQGNVNISVDETDPAGNPATTITRTFIKDTQVPTVTIANPAALTYINQANAQSFAVSGACSENGRNVSVSAASGALTPTPVCGAGAWNTSFNIATEIDRGWIPKASNLVALYHFNETAGTTGASSVIDSVSGNNGTPGTGMTFGTAGKISKRADFDGSGANGKITLATHAAPIGNNSRTITMWINTPTLPSSNNQECMMVWGANGTHIGMSLCLYNNAGTQTVEMGGYNDDHYYNYTIPTNTWTFVAYTYDGTTSAISINGAAPDTQSHPLWNTLAGTLIIGNSAWSNAVPFPGSMDEIAIWNTALSPAEITSIYNAQAGTYFAEGTFATTADHSDVGGNNAIQATRNFIKDTVSPTVASFTVLNTSPTPSQVYLLSSSGISETISKYCILENDTNVGNCAWTTSATLPSSYTTTATQNAKVLSLWVQDVAGNTSARIDSNSVTLSQAPLAISPTAPTITRTYSWRSVDGKKVGSTATALNDGTILITGGCKGTNYYGGTKTYDAGTNKYIARHPLMYPRCFHQAVKLPNGKVMVMGGLINGTTATNTTEIYDPATGVWSGGQPMASARAYHSATTTNGGTQIFVAGGHNGSAAAGYSSTEIYNTTAGIWYAGPSITGVRFNHQAVSIASGEVVLLGGQSAAATYLNTVQKYTPATISGTVSSLAPMATNRADFGVAVLANSTESGLPSGGGGGEGILIAGGYDGAASQTSIALYDVVQNSWATKASVLTTAKRYAQLYRYASDGAVLIYAGDEQKTYLYTTSTDTLTAKANQLNVYRQQAGTAVLPNGNVALFYGDNSTWFGDLGGAAMPVAYNRTGNSWASLPYLYTSPNSEGTSLALSNGKGMYCSGKMASSYTPNAVACQIYDPATDSISFTAAPTNVREWNKAKLVELASGKVLWIGGTIAGGTQMLKVGEIYDPGTDTWSVTSAMPNYSEELQAVAIPGNKVVVFNTTGEATNNWHGGAPVYLHEIYVYNVAGNSWTDITATSPFPHANSNAHLVTTPTGRIFLIGGVDSTLTVSGAIYEFDPTTYAWTSSYPAMANPRAQMGASYVSLNGIDYIYVSSGCNAFSALFTCTGYTQTMEAFNLTTNTWSSIGTTSGQNMGYLTYSPGDQSFLVAISFSSNVKRVPISTNVGANKAASNPSSFFGGGLEVRLNDGRIMLVGSYNDDFGMSVFNVASPVQYTATGGDGNYTFSQTGGTGGTFYPFTGTFIPSDSMTGTPATIQVADTATHTATSTVTVDIVLPTLASVTIQNVSPSPSRGYFLSYSGPSEPISQYCILENDTVVGHCAWTVASSLPSSYNVTKASGTAITLSFWVRDLAGNQQAVRTDSNVVTYSNTLAIAPAGNTTLTQTFSTESVEGARAGHIAVMLGNGKILVAGGCWSSWGSNRYYSIAKLYDPVGDTWTYAGHMNLPRCYSAWTSLQDGRVLVAGGLTANNTSTTSAEIYDPTSNKWVMTYPMGVSRAHATATVLSNGKVLIAGGYTNTNSAANTNTSTELYDPTSQVWLTGPTMASKRQDHSAIRLTNGRVLLIGGSTSNTTATNTSDIFIPTGNTGAIIATANTMTNSRADFGAVLLGAAESPTGSEAVLVLGGYDGNATYRTGVELYDGTNWSAKTSITTSRRGALTTKLSDGTIFVSGGYNGAFTTSSGNYNPLGAAGAGTWTAKAALAVGENHHLPITLANGKIFTILGESTGSMTGLGYVQIYDPVGNSWDDGTKADLYTAGDNMAAVHLQHSSGKVFICGSRTGWGIELPRCQYYDPQKASIESVAYASSFRGNPTMAELADARVMVMGGFYNGTSTIYNTAEIYNFATNTWTTTAVMPKYMVGAVATALPSNRILWVGGKGGNTNNATAALSTTAIYDVAGNSWTTPTSLTTGVYHHRLVTTPTGRIFVFGGYDGAAAVKKLYEWNDAGTNWTAKTDATTARVAPAAVYIPGGTAGKILVTAGYSDNFTTTLSSAEIYDIGTDTWSAATSMPTAENALCGAYVASMNQVFFSGVQNGWAYRYDVAGNSWLNTFTGNYYLGSSAPTSGHGKVCGVLQDGRFWIGNATYDDRIFELWNVATPVKYSASQGDGSYTFSIVGGGTAGGFLDNRNTFIPTTPLTSSTSTTIRVDDGSGQNATATVSVP